MTIKGEKIVFQGINTHNLKNIDIELPKNKIITVTGVSGSGKSSLAFDTIYKEGQFRYIESLSSYLRQFFNLGDRPDILHCEGLSPAIAIEQNKKAGNSRSSVGTLTEIDDYLRLMFSKLGEPYCYECGKKIEPQTIEQIMDIIKTRYNGKKIFLLKESGEIKDPEDIKKFVKKNRNKVEKGGGFTRYLISPAIQTSEGASLGKEGPIEPIEFFYLEEPNIPENFLPAKIYGIYDRITIENKNIDRLKEDIIKILAEIDKFGVWCESHVIPAKAGISAGRPERFLPSQEGQGSSQEGQSRSGNDTQSTGLEGQGNNLKGQESISRFTDKMYCPNCNIKYPEFTPQHFSPNRQEGACATCHGLGEVLQADLDKLIDPDSPYHKAILPRRDSTFGQAVLKKVAEKYSMDQDTLRRDLPDWFQHTVIYGDEELLRINTGGKYTSLRYQGIEYILKEQYIKGLLTVDFQAMLNMSVCPDCNGAKLKKESLHMLIEANYPPDKGGKGGFSGNGKDNINPPNPPVRSSRTEYQGGDKSFSKLLSGKAFYNISDFQTLSLDDLLKTLENYKKSIEKDNLLVNRITTPLINRVKTITDLGLGYINLSRGMDTLSGGEIQRLRLTKQLGNKLSGIVYVLDEPTIGLSHHEIKKVIKSIKHLKDMGNTIIVVEHNEEFIKASDWVVEIGPHAGDFGGEVMFNGPYKDFLKSDTLTAKYINGTKKVELDFSHNPTSQKIQIKKASKYNLNNIDIDINLGSFTVITGPSGAGKTTLMYTTLYKFLNDKPKFVQSYIRLQLLKKGMSWEEIISAPVMQKEIYEHYENLATQEFYKEINVENIQGYDSIKNTIYVDQTSIGKTPRSCPATFIGTFDKIRQLYAGTTQAKYLGFNTGHFSFNSSKGACTACKGYGYKKIELQFLPDTYVACDLCKGKRYKPEILEIKWNGKTISEVLSMYLDEAVEFFKEMTHINEEFELMQKIGLGYIKLGQPAHTLSGGESQRIKLVKHLLKDYKGHTVYFLDEPTVGLHPNDIEKLLIVLREFLDSGDTILMIEHDQDILQFADKVIELDNGKVIKES